VKTIGLVGGMSWTSSAYYYDIINEEMERRLGPLHSGRIILYSIEFTELEDLQREGRWQEASDYITDKARIVENAGADVILICSNTGNEGADRVAAAISTPLLNIIDCTAESIVEKGYRKIGLLGTEYTMEKDYFKGRLAERYGIEVIVPDREGRRLTHDIIYDELCLGDIKEVSRKAYQGIIATLAESGAEAIVLGCTELPLIIKQEDYEIPLLDTTRIHALEAVEFALKE
jgi:aspartate racemase